MKKENVNRIYLGKSVNYIKNINRVINRIMMIKRIIFNGNCILVSDIKEFVEDNERGREVKVTTSTYYDDNSDYYSVLAAANILEKIIKENCNK